MRAGWNDLDIGGGEEDAEASAAPLRRKSPIVDSWFFSVSAENVQLRMVSNEEWEPGPQTQGADWNQ